MNDAGDVTLSFDHEPTIRMTFSDPFNTKGTIEGDDREYSFRLHRSAGE